MGLSNRSAETNKGALRCECPARHSLFPGVSQTKSVLRNPVEVVAERVIRESSYHWISRCIMDCHVAINRAMCNTHVYKQSLNISSSTP